MSSASAYPVRNFGGAGSGHTHTNKTILDSIAVDAFGQLYYNTGYSMTDLKSQSVLCLLGSTTDASGYGNNAVNSGSAYPTQVTGLDGQPALNFASTNSQLRCQNLQSSLTGSTGATIYTVFRPQNSEFSLCEHTATNQFDSWWRWSGSSRGYIGLFRNIRVDHYPFSVSVGNWQCWSIHSRASDYEVIINKASQGVQVAGINGVSGTYWQGNDFFVSPNWRSFLGDLALLIVIPYWVDKAGTFHQAKMAAIKGRFLSLPFTV